VIEGLYIISSISSFKKSAYILRKHKIFFPHIGFAVASATTQEK
jgi:hypothetical protein